MSGVDVIKKVFPGRIDASQSRHVAVATRLGQGNGGGHRVAFSDRAHHLLLTPSLTVGDGLMEHSYHTRQRHPLISTLFVLFNLNYVGLLYGDILLYKQTGPAIRY